MRPGRIEVQIDELVLHGFEAVDAERVGDAVVARLEESLRRRPNGLRKVDAPLVESEQPAATGLRDPALAELVATSLDGALRR